MRSLHFLFLLIPILAAGAADAGEFVNPVAEGADPWLVQHQGRTIACLSEANRGIALHISDRLTRLGPKRVVWRAPKQGMCSREVWAPELHFLDGRWYVYFAASDGNNRNHRMWALRSQGEDPLGPYTLHGPLYTGDHPETGADNRWAIDGTVLELGGRRYLIWSGWQDERDMQWLYIAPMSDPLTVAGKRVRLCANDDYLWEHVDEQPTGRGLHEAPEVLQHEGRTFLTYSCSGSWQPSYKLGLLELRAGGDPLNPADWTKHPRPVFESTAATYGVGHNCFLQSPDGRENWLVYHAKRDLAPGWHRAIFMQPFRWAAQGLPDFGSPVAPGAPLALPSGETERRITGKVESGLGRAEDLDGWSYFGHHQFIQVDGGRLHLGRKPREAINDYRSGEKVVLNDGAWSAVRVGADVRPAEGGRDAGVLFRVGRPSVGYNAQQGYFAGIIPRTRKVVLGSTDGARWREIALVDVPVEVGRDYRLDVEARGEEITVKLDGKVAIEARDGQWRSGSVGLRVVDTEASFAKFAVEGL